MQKNKKTIFWCITTIILFTLGLVFLGYKNTTIKNTKLNVELTERPRLEDDFYDYINYDKLSQKLIDESNLSDVWTYYSDYAEKIENEKKDIINTIVASCDTYTQDSPYSKLCTYYNSLKNMDYNANKTTLDEYVNLINSSKNIEEYLNNIAIVNNKLYNTNILFTLSFDIKDLDFDEAYPEIDYMFYDYTNSTYYYNSATISSYGKERNTLKNADLKILMKYGYEEAEARKIVADVYEMYAEIAKFSSLWQEDDEAKLYSYVELKNKYPNINFDLIKNELDSRYEVSDYVLVLDESQLNLINKYLVNDNLETLKNYALLRILYSYGDTIDNNIYDIINKLDKDLSGDITTTNDEDYIYDAINYLFNDTITLEFAKKHSYDKLKDYYTELINNYLEEYRVRINSETWLSDTTKNNALKKIDNMGINVLYPDYDKAIYYNVTGNNFYEVDYNIYNSYIKYLFNNIKDYDVLTNDWLEVNAFYSPMSNLILLELGYVYAFNSAMEIDINKINDYYYETLGGIGYTIGHELSHAFDNTGSQYDEYGKKNNWWTNEDKIAYNKLNLKVEKYYDKLGQDGYQTLGENIADLGGFGLTIQIAESKQATNDDYKKIFESAAKFDAMQSSSFFNGWLLLNDEHSSNKNRINGVYSSLDKFYEVYNISKNDKMYVAPSERVRVW